MKQKEEPMSNICNAGTASRRRNYKKYIKKPEYTFGVEKILTTIKRGHASQDRYAKEYSKMAEEIAAAPVVQQMKTYNHHSHTNCYEHSVHVSYYNYLICKKLGWDTQAAVKAGLLHDLFLYDWHGRKPEPGERRHGFEHPTKALRNAQKNFPITRKEGDMIVKHMFPLTVTPPMYKETFVIVMTDKFCSTCEVLDRFFKESKRKTFYPSNSNGGKA
jgi:uncharacterized protein